MGVGDRPPRPAFEYLLIGLKTGILAALAMLAWLGISSAWYRRSVWTAANLFAATFYGESALHNRFNIHTFSGLGLYFVIYGGLGILFGLAIQDRHSNLRTMCIAILTAIAWYYLFFGWIWKRWDPLLVLYTHDRAMFAGHVLYGAILGQYSKKLPPNATTGVDPSQGTVPVLTSAQPATADPGDLEIKN